MSLSFLSADGLSEAGGPRIAPDRRLHHELTATQWPTPQVPAVPWSQWQELAVGGVCIAGLTPEPHPVPADTKHPRMAGEANVRQVFEVF
jgi:hypothetical protein